MDEKLMVVTQLPQFQENLHAIKATLEARSKDALALAATEENLPALKKERAELNKIRKELDAQWKAVYQQAMAPIEAFKAVYKECVPDVLGPTDEALKERIDAITADKKSPCEQDLRDYFAELCAAEHIDWLTFEQCGVTVDMASAKQKTPKRLMERIRERVTGVSKAVAAIETMEYSDELLVEFKRLLNLPLAISTVQERHQAIQREAEAKEARKEVLEREAQAVQRVEAVAPPIVKEVSDEKVYTARFTVHATKDKLLALKQFLIENDIKYENG